MRVINVTRDCVLATRAWEAVTPFERAKGLLGRDSLKIGEGIYIHPCTSIHSFFMRFIFDAAFIGHDKKILHIINQMKKYRVSKFVYKARGVIELPAGVLRITQTKQGDYINFEH